MYRPWIKSIFVNVIIKITWFWSSPSTRGSDTSPFNPKMSNRIVGEKFWLTSLDKMIVQENHAKIEVVKPILCNQSIWFTSRWSSTQSLPSEGKARHKFGGRRQAAAQQLRGGGILATGLRNIHQFIMIGVDNSNWAARTTTCSATEMKMD